MRSVYINGKFLTQPVTGVQRFALNFCQDLNNKKLFTILTPRSYKLNSVYGIKVKNIGFLNGHLWEQVELPLYLFFKGKNNYLLNLCNLAPILYRKNIVAIMDLSFFQDTSWFSWSFKKIYKFLIPIIIKHSKQIFTISRFSRLELKRMFNVDAPIVYPRSSFVINPNKKTYDSSDNFFISVGSNNPRKNTNFLFNSFLKLKLNLLIVGQSSNNFKKTSNIEFLYLNDKDLKIKLLSAKALLSASSYEGFNLPPLEAQSLGTPLVISDIPVHREVYKDSAIYFKLNSPSSLIIALDQLKSAKIYSKLIKKGFENVNRFNELRLNNITLANYGITFNNNINKGK
jgi:glycosyltransferase involved in cell wall biosynthesis